MRLRVLIGWGVFFFLVALIVHVMPSPRGTFYFLKGKQRFAARDFQGAANAFNETVKSDPQFVRGYVELGSAFLALKQNKEAETAFNQAIALEDNACAYCGLGASLRVQDRNDEAETALTKATKIDPRDYCAFDQLGRLYYDSKNYKKAIDAFTKVVSLKPSATSYHYLANSFYRSGEVEKSIDNYIAATRRSSRNAKLFIDLARAYHETGSEHESMIALQRAVELDPANEQAHAYLGVSHFVLGNDRAALEQYEWLRANSPKLATELWKSFEEIRQERTRIYEQRYSTEAPSEQARPKRSTTSN